MTTYLVKVFEPCSSYSGYPTFIEKSLFLNDKKEFKKVFELCQNRKNMITGIKASVVPIRTDRFDTLAKDLFFPTLLSQVESNQDRKAFHTHTVGSAILITVSLLWDLMTLPIRLLTLIPRIYHNKYVKPSEHPLQIFLREKGILINKQTCVSGPIDCPEESSDPQEIRVSLSKIKIYKNAVDESGQHYLCNSGRNYHLAFFDREFAFSPSNYDFSEFGPSYKKVSDFCQKSSS